MRESVQQTMNQLSVTVKKKAPFWLGAFLLSGFGFFVLMRVELAFNGIGCNLIGRLDSMNINLAGCRDAGVSKAA